jgi:hypothetical protein
MSIGNVIESCFVSEPLEPNRKTGWINKGALLPARSATAKFNRTSSNISSGRSEGGYTSLDEWFDDGPELEMKEDVVGLGSYGRTLTVLFTSEALDDGDDDSESDDT